MLADELAAFADANGFQSQGPLGVAITVTRKAEGMAFPLDPDAFLTPNKSRVSGLNGAGVDRVLLNYGVLQSIGTEAGRTSPASAENMRTYVAELNRLAVRGPIDLEEATQFWVNRVQAYFESQPFTIKLDPSLGVRAIVRDVLDQAEKRQKESKGLTIVGTVMQHLVGAKIEAALDGRLAVTHHSASASDASGRGGDFDLGDTCIHVTVRPGDLLLSKCRRNLSAGLRPIVVTSAKGAQLAELQWEEADRLRIDIVEVEQFVAANVHELGLFSSAGRATAITDIIRRYNEIIARNETNRSLQIALE